MDSNLQKVTFLIFIFLTFQLNNAEVEDRTAKILPVFQVVRFPNDPCIITGGAKNGTCYTTEECSTKGGTNGGSCASGFGVCCIFTTGCGSSSSENCTYFEASTLVDGECTGRICKCNDNICQIRLDFDSFVITGPSTNTVSIGHYLNGQVTDAGDADGLAYSLATNCRTDIFTVGGTSVPSLCGTLSGQHLYFEAESPCHDLSFALGQAAIGVTKATDRKFSIKATQIPCNADYKAPAGCLQYHTGTASSEGVVKTFNYDQGLHLADQRQTICFRREQGNCRVCFTADDADVDLSGKTTKVVNKQASSCCQYGSKGVKTGGFDCLIIPGAEKKTAAATNLLVGECQGGGGMGLGSVVDAKAAVTICSSVQPFQIAFFSDGYEAAIESTAAISTKGFSIKYFQTAC